MKHQNKINKNELTPVEHFSELKRRVLIAVVVFIVFFVICLYYNHFFMDVIMKLGENANYQFVVLTPAETIIQTFRISGVFAFLIALPVLIYEILSFISPVFEENHAMLKLVLLSIAAFGIFFLGCFFTYKFLLPFTLKYLIDYTGNYNVKSQVSLESYISFVSLIIFCIGIMFEMPVVSSILAKMGILPTYLMQKLIKPVIFIIFVVAAIITPPDVVSQLMVALPMCVLFMFSVFCVKIINGSKKDEVSEV